MKIKAVMLRGIFAVALAALALTSVPAAAEAQGGMTAEAPLIVIKPQNVRSAMQRAEREPARSNRAEKPGLPRAIFPSSSTSNVMAPRAGTSSAPLPGFALALR